MPAWGGIDAGSDGYFATKFIRFVGFALADDALHFRRMPTVEFLWSVSGLIERNAAFCVRSQQSLGLILCPLAQLPLHISYYPA